jgi:hypothetical protein
MRTLLLVSLLLTAGCTRSISWPSSGVYTGYYTHGYEPSRFVPANTKEKWSLAGAFPCRELFTSDGRVVRLDNPAIYIETRGTLSPNGKYGHLGAYSRELTVSEVLTCRKLWSGERSEF